MVKISIYIFERLVQTTDGYDFEIQMDYCPSIYWKL